MRYLYLSAIMIFLLIGCSKPDSLTAKQEEKLVIEQYFYSQNEEPLKKLAEKLKLAGYQINDFKSYELEGTREWYFYSSKEINNNEIDEEDLKSEQYAKDYNVKYDGHGFSIE